MGYLIRKIQRKIQTWRLPKTTLFAFAVVFLTLSILTAKVAWEIPGVGADDVVTLDARLTSYHTEKFKSSKTLRLKTHEHCGEFLSALYDSFAFERFVRDYSPGMAIRLTVRLSDSLRLESCQPVEFLSLSSGQTEYLSLAQRNRSALAMRRLVAGIITGILITAGLLLALVGFISLSDSGATDAPDEFWERKSVFKR